MCRFITQLVEHRTGIAEVTGSNPVEALIFFQASFQLLKLYRDTLINFYFLSLAVKIDIATLRFSQFTQCLTLNIAKSSYGIVSSLSIE